VKTLNLHLDRMSLSNRIPCLQLFDVLGNRSIERESSLCGLNQVAQLVAEVQYPYQGLTPSLYPVLADSISPFSALSFRDCFAKPTPFNCTFDLAGLQKRWRPAVALSGHDKNDL